MVKRVDAAPIVQKVGVGLGVLGRHQPHSVALITGVEMKRRTFVGVAIAALATPYLSAADLAAPCPAKPLNAASLTAALEGMFSCQAGPANSVFDLVAGNVVNPMRLEVAHRLMPDYMVMKLGPIAEGGKRYEYATYVCAVEGGSAEDAEMRLAQHFYDSFSKLPSGQLVWRVKPEFESQEVTEWGDTYLTAEQIEDEVWKVKEGLRANGKLRSYRDHAATLEIPEGVALDPITDSYRHIKRRFTLHKMRMRLCLPDLYDHEQEEYVLPNLVPQDGAKTPRLSA